MSDALRRALRISVPIVVGLLAIACFLRIDYVNAHAPQIVEENYENADWVDLDGSFAGLADEKPTDSHGNWSLLRSCHPSSFWKPTVKHRSI